MAKKLCVCEECGKQFEVPEVTDPASVSCTNCGHHLTRQAPESARDIHECDHCEKKYKVPSDRDPSTVTCKRCGNSLTSAREDEPGPSRSQSSDETSRMMDEERSGSSSGRGSPGGSSPSPSSEGSSNGSRTGSSSRTPSRGKKTEQGRSSSPLSSRTPEHAPARSNGESTRLPSGGASSQTPKPSPSGAGGTGTTPSGQHTPTGHRRGTGTNTPATDQMSGQPFNKQELKEEGRKTNSGNTKLIIGLCSLGVILFVGIIILATGSSSQGTSTDQPRRNRNVESVDATEDKSASDVEEWKPGGHKTEKARRRQKGRQNQEY